MTDTSLSNLGEQPADFLARFFTGHLGSNPALGGGLVVGTVMKIEAPYCVVDVGLGEPGIAVWHCYYEPRYKPPSSTALVPPNGTVCVIAAPKSAGGAGDQTPWVLAFQGWPS